jgi:hypothetical protein
MSRNQPSPLSPREVWAGLATYYRHFGYVRRPRRPAFEDTAWEVRFVLDSAAQLQELRPLLVKAGFKPAEPFRKHRYHMQPLYGRKAVEMMLTLWARRGRPG